MNANRRGYGMVGSSTVFGHQTMNWTRPIVGEGSVRVVAPLLLFSPALAETACSAGRDPNAIDVSSVEQCTQAIGATQVADIPLQGRRKEFFSHYPLAQVRKWGGSIVKSPSIVAVFFSNDWMQSPTEALLQSYGCTSFWHDAVDEYGVGTALYKRTVVLPATEVSRFTDGGAGNFSAFSQWVADGAEANEFGALSDGDVLMFFLPANIPASKGDCVSSEGAHSSVVTKNNRRIRFAYVDTCSLSDDPSVLAERTIATTHELIEMVTDPDEDAWRSLGPGLVDPSVSLPQTSIDDEVADLCNNRIAQSPGYPFEVAQAYSNRLARAGLDPCGPYPAVQRIVAVRSTGFQPAAIDLSSGYAHVVLDIFSDDPSATYTLTAYGSVTPGPYASLLPRGELSVRDGDTVPLDLHFAARSSTGPAEAASAQVQFFLCGPDEDPGDTCSISTFPMLGWPMQPAADAAVQDATDAGPEAGDVSPDAGDASVEANDVSPDAGDAGAGSNEVSLDAGDGSAEANDVSPDAGDAGPEDAGVSPDAG